MKKLSLLFFVLVVIGLAFTGCAVNTSPGTGSKIGQVVKISKQGMLSKTWEAQLIRGGLNGGSGSFGATPFDFTIENEKQAEQVQEYMNKQTEVVITYRMEGIYAATRSDSSGHFLETIRPATNTPSTKVSAEKQ